MISDMQNVEALARVISQATAPSFLLGAAAGFASILTTRMERIRIAAARSTPSRMMTRPARLSRPTFPA